MALKSTNPTTTHAWKALKNHFQTIQKTTIKELFAQNANRFEEFSIQYPSLLVDYSKNRINAETIQLLVDLAKEMDVDTAIQQMFEGDVINVTEKELFCIQLYATELMKKFWLMEKMSCLKLMRF